MKKYLLAGALLLGFAFPACGQTLICGKAASGSGCFPIPVADTSISISSNGNATTVLVTGVVGKRIFVTNFNLYSAGTANGSFVYGTGTTCGTGTTSLTGVYTMTTQGRISVGGGLGPVLVVPAGMDLCFVNSASVLLAGSISYAQF
jgi:hypothetical protein